MHLHKYKTVNEAKSKVQELMEIILTTTRKAGLTRALSELVCIVKGNCLCDTCPEWDNDAYVLYEFSRCLVTTHSFQLMKEKHCKTKRWAFVMPLYAELYNAVFEDIMPHTGAIASIDEEHIHGHAKCTFKLSAQTMDTALAQIKEQRTRRVSEQLKARRCVKKSGCA